MSKKKEIKPIFENLEVESSEASPKKLEPQSEQPRQESDTQQENPALDDDLLMARMELEVEERQPDPIPPAGEATHSEEPAPSEPVNLTGQDSEEENPDDILEDVRRSLLEEEAQVQEEQPWWKRIGKSSRKKKEEEEAPRPAEEINLPALTSMATTDVEADAVPETEADEYQEQLDELIDLLDVEEEPVEKDLALTTVESPPVEPEPERPVDLEDLKKQAFQARPVKEEETEVRSIALEGDEEVFVEVESKPQDPLQERLNAVENALKPYQRYINFALAFMGVIMAVLAVFLIYNAYQSSQARQAPVQEVSNLPYPTSVGLPGGWQFKLGKGSLTADGNWNPSGAEWLQGTEVCRWVALPWSTQLEAVIRTLKADDPIDLGMSNNDTLTYNVYSIRQMSPAEMRELDSNSPCLLIVLAEPDAEKRWVLTALP